MAIGSQPNEDLGGFAFHVRQAPEAVIQSGRHFPVGLTSEHCALSDALEACAQCHVADAGKRLRGDAASQGLGYSKDEVTAHGFRARRRESSRSLQCYGPVKAALEASVRYLAHELGRKSIRVNAISAGAVATRAASGITHFDELLNETVRKAPLRRTWMHARSGAPL